MKTKKLLALVASAALMLSVFTACNNDSGSGDGSGDGQEAITLVHAYWDNPESSQDLMTQLYGKGQQDFNETVGAENNVTIEWMYINSNDYGTKMTALGVANDMPDTLMQQPGAKTQEMGEAGYILDMNSSWKQIRNGLRLSSMVWATRLLSTENSMLFRFSSQFLLYSTTLELFEQGECRCEPDQNLG